MYFEDSLYRYIFNGYFIGLFCEYNVFLIGIYIYLYLRGFFIVMYIFVRGKNSRKCFILYCIYIYKEGNYMV